MLTEQTFITNEVPINFVVEGTANHPLLLLHGITERWQTFLPLISHLSNKWRIYALDLRGHGKSGRVKNQYRIVDYAQDVVCFVESLISEPAVILGHSIGALTAICVAAKQRELITAAVLVEPPLHLQHTPLRDIPNSPYETFKHLVEIIRANQSQRAIENGLLKLFPYGDPDTRRARAEVLSQLDTDALALSLENLHLAGLDLNELLMQIASPTLLIQGNPNQGAALFDEDVNRALALLHYGERVTIQNGGHMLHQSHPRAIAESVNIFCEKWM